MNAATAHGDLVAALRRTLASVEREEPTLDTLHDGLLQAARELHVDESRTVEILRAVYREAFKRMALESAHDLDAETLTFPRYSPPESWLRRHVAAVARPLLKLIGGTR